MSTLSMQNNKDEPDDIELAAAIQLEQLAQKNTVISNLDAYDNYYKDADEAYTKKVKSAIEVVDNNGECVDETRGIAQLKEILDQIKGQKDGLVAVKFASKVESYGPAISGFLDVLTSFCKVPGPSSNTFIAHALAMSIAIAFKITKDHIDFLEKVKRCYRVMGAYLHLFELLKEIHSESSPEVKEKVAEQFEILGAIALKFWAKVVSKVTPVAYFAIVTRKEWDTFESDLSDFNNQFACQINNISVISKSLIETKIQKEAEGRQHNKEILKLYDSCVRKFKTRDSDPTLFADDLARLRGRKHEGTCEWIREDMAYKDWKDGDTDILWLSGDAGMGKSVLAASLIQRHLEEEACSPKNAVLYFFCLHDQPEKRNTVAIFRSLCFQMFNRIVPSVEALENDADGRITLAEGVSKLASESFSKVSVLMQQFSDLRKRFSNVTVFIDGLDECRESEIESLLNNLLRFVGKSPSDGSFLRVLITSRPEPPIQSGLLPANTTDDYADRTFNYDPRHHEEGTKDHPIESYKCQLLRLHHLKIIPKHVSHDIKLYVDYKLRKKLKNARENLLRKNDLDCLAIITADEKNDQRIRTITEDFYDQSGGHFLWVFFMLKYVTVDEGLTGVEQFLTSEVKVKNTEQGTSALLEVYKRIVCRLERTLNPDAKIFVRCILGWCCCAYRPLRLEELAEVIMTNTKRLDPERKKQDSWLRYTEVEIRKLCGSLVTFRSSGDMSASTRNRTLHFVHFSIKEFLLSTTTENLQFFATTHDEEFYGMMTGEFLVPPARGHTTIFEDSISYLCRKVFAQPLEHVRGNAFNIDDVRSRFPLFEYAALNWFRHLLDCTRFLDSIERAMPTLKDPELQQTQMLVQKMKTVYPEVVGKFFDGNTSKTWMEGIIGFKGGIETLYVVQIALKKKILDGHLDSKLLKAFFDWAEDIKGFGFLDYEQTMLHNTNELHFLDEMVLFPKLLGAYASDRETRSLVRAEIFQNLTRDYSSKSTTSALPEHISSHNSQANSAIASILNALFTVFLYIISLVLRSPPPNSHMKNRTKPS